MTTALIPKTGRFDSSPAITEARIYAAQTLLLELVDKFAARGNYSPVQAAHDLLTYWLSTPAPQLVQQVDKDQFHAVLLLIDALGEVYPVTSLPTIDETGDLTEPLGMVDKCTLRLSGAFLNHFDLSDNEEERAGLLIVPDEAMTPQLVAGSEVLVVAYERADYCQASGVVVAVLDIAPGRYFVGRVQHNDGISLLLGRDNGLFSDERFLLSEIRYLASVRYLINSPVL